MFATCWNTVPEADHPLRKEIFLYVYSIVTWLQFISMTMGYAVSFENKELGFVNICIMEYNLTLPGQVTIAKVPSFLA